jgi:hypothetical protein
MSVFDGDIAIEKIKAWSIPRRSSAMRAQLLVEKTNERPYVTMIGQSHCSSSIGGWIHTVSLAVARTSPSGLRSIALRGDPWASIKLTFPLPISTICSCPGVLPGRPVLASPGSRDQEGYPQSQTPRVSQEEMRRRTCGCCSEGR